jgi:ElaB/YqjD/DUF883 family membrane-anchored ribosome-binding protein
MPNNDPNFNSGTTTMPGNAGARSATEGVRERVSDFTNQAREKANEFGRKSADTIDRNLDAAAGKLASTADAIRSKATSGEDKVGHLANTAADKLDATARYFRDHHTRDMVSGVESLVRQNPGASICAALAIGFFLGAAMRRDRY